MSKPSSLESVVREFNGMPVVDATADMRIVILPEDLRGAKKKSFEQCVLAKACYRQFKSEKVLFLHTVAYVAIPDEHGKKRVERFIVSESGKKMIEGFDAGKKLTPGAAFVLRAPKGATKLDDIRKKARAKRKAILRGEIERDGPYKNTGRNSTHRTVNMKVRNGTGLIQMALKD